MKTRGGYRRIVVYKGRYALIGIISRLIQQKGFDLIEHMMAELMDLGLQIIVLGTVTNVTRIISNGLTRYLEGFQPTYAMTRYWPKGSMPVAICSSCHHS